MSTRSIFWAGIFGVAATIPLVQTVAIAKSAVEINRVAESITVMITEPNNQGSGVILQRQGDVYTVLTAAHVVKNARTTYQIVAPDGQKYQVISNSIRRPQVDIDLAIVKFRAAANYSTAKLGNSNLLTGGTDLYVGGYPGVTATITESVFVFRTGTVSANSNKTFEKGYSLIYSNDTLPGMSGGAVLNGEGELVAIHGRGDRQQSSNGELGAKTGFNLGIPINRFGTIATSLGVTPSKTVAAIPQTTAPKADDYFVSAIKKYERGDNRGALADFDRAITLNPNYGYAYNNRGNLKDKLLNDWQGALADYNQAISLSPNNAAPYNNRGGLKHTRLNDTQGALADYNRAIALDPTMALAYYNRGIVKVGKLNDVQGAIADYNRAITLNPNYSYAYNNRGNVKYQRLNDTLGALADYNQAIALDSKNAEAYYNRANAKERLNDVQGALADFDRVIALNPNFAAVYTNRGALKNERLNDVRGALADYDRAIVLDPNQALAYNNRGNLKDKRLNDTQGALADFDLAIAINPNLALAYINRGKLKYLKLKDPAGAVSDFNRVAQLSPNLLAEFNLLIQSNSSEGNSYYNRGLWKYLQLNDRAGGIIDMRQAAKLFKQQNNLAGERNANYLLKKWGATDSPKGTLGERNSGF